MKQELVRHNFEMRNQDHILDKQSQSQSSYNDLEATQVQYKHIGWKRVNKMQPEEDGI